jgi:hypothetical protein
VTPAVVDFVTEVSTLGARTEADDPMTMVMPATNPGVVVVTLVAPAARDATPEMVGVCPTTASVARNDDVDPTKVTVNVPVVLGLTALASPIVEATPLLETLVRSIPTWYVLRVVVKALAAEVTAALTMADATTLREKLPG